VAVSQTNLGAPVYLRDLVEDIARGYDTRHAFSFTNRATHRAIGRRTAHRARSLFRLRPGDTREFVIVEKAWRAVIAGAMSTRSRR